MGKQPRRPSAAAALIGLGGHHRIAPDILRDRVLDRAQREALDTRTDIEKMLGDPAQNRSALADRLPVKK